MAQPAFWDPFSFTSLAPHERREKAVGAGPEEALEFFLDWWNYARQLDYLKRVWGMPESEARRRMGIPDSPKPRQPRPDPPPAPGRRPAPRPEDPFRFASL